MVADYVSRCGNSYLNNSVSRRFLKQMTLYHKVSGGEGVAVAVEEFNAEEVRGGEGGGEAKRTSLQRNE